MEDDQKDPGPTRTELAEDRTILANERTFAGWIRTSLGCIAIGIGFHALFNTMQPSWVPKAIATTFLLLAPSIVWLAYRRATLLSERLSAHVVDRARRPHQLFVSSCISIGAVALALAVWLLPLG